MLLGIFVALKAVAYWLDRYGLAVKSSDFKATDNWTGLRYVDANAYLPAKTILFCIAVICALLFFATLWRRTWQLPGHRLRPDGALGDPDRRAVPGDRAEVPGPAERAGQGSAVRREEPQGDARGVRHRRRRGRRTTRARATPTDKTELRDDADATASIRAARPEHRLADVPAAPADAELLRSSRPTWTSTATDEDGKEQDTVIGLRELNIAGIPKQQLDQRPLPLHPRLRRGRGQGHHGRRRRPPGLHRVRPAVQGRRSARTSSGSTTARRPTSTRSSAVPQKELDYADDSGEKTTSYKGKSGVNLSNPVNRAAYAVAFSEPQILYSGAIGEGSRILYNRTPKERVEAVAPWLTIDGDAYPAVVDGRIQWIVDAYTTTNGYPYASRTTLGDTTADSLTATTASARWWPSRTRSTTSATR